jgi:hypothetical protein
MALPISQFAAVVPPSGTPAQEAPQAESDMLALAACLAESLAVSIHEASINIAAAIIVSAAAPALSNGVRGGKWERDTIQHYMAIHSRCVSALVAQGEDDVQAQQGETARGDDSRRDG